MILCSWLPYVGDLFCSFWYLYLSFHKLYQEPSKEHFQAPLALETQDDRGGRPTKTKEPPKWNRSQRPQGHSQDCLQPVHQIQSCLSLRRFHSWNVNLKNNKTLIWDWWMIESINQLTCHFFTKQMRLRQRCQIWCTIELHRDPISKVLSEW